MRRAAYAYVALALLQVLLSGAALMGAVTYYHREQAAQKQQGAVFEAKLCATLARQAALNPPGGSPGDNPSRAYLQAQHAVLAELGPDVGCRR